MPPSSTPHYVFVDFENVSTIDLTEIRGKTVRVTLLIGLKQTKLPLSFVRQIHGFAAQVELIEVGAAGHNALDLTLAYHLGQAAMRDPAGHFYIISRDKDFDPLVAHLKPNVRVSRHASFEELPFLRHLARHVEQGSDDTLALLIERFRNRPTARPAKRKTLVTHIQNMFATLSASEVEEAIGQLEEKGVIAIDDRDRVSYR